MAATIPTISPRASFDVERSPTPQIGNSFGEALGNFGAALQDLAGGWQAASSINVYASYQDFKLNETKMWDQSAHDLKPANAPGFAQQYETAYQKRADAWLQQNAAGMSPADTARWRAELGGFRNQLVGSAIKLEGDQQFAYVTNGLNDTLNNSIAPRAQLAAKLPDDAAKAVTLQGIEEDAFALIDKSALSEAQKDDKKLEVGRAIQEGFARALPPAEMARLDPGNVDETVVDRILSVEGRGKNPQSSAEGPGQFVDETWLRMIKQYRPDLAEGRSNVEILALRSGPDADNIGAEMTRAYSQENAAALQYHNIEATRGNLYLSHFLGAEGAVDMLSADPGAIAADINPAAAKANPTVFYNAGQDGRGVDYNNPKTAGEVAQWAAGLMGGAYHNDWARQLDKIPFDQKVNLAHDGSQALVSQRTAEAKAASDQYKARLNGLQNAVEDGTAGYADVAAAYDGGKGWLNDATDRTALNNAIQSRDKEVLDLAKAQGLMQGNAPIVAQDPDQKKLVNLWYDKLGGAGTDLYEPDGSGVATLRYAVTRSQMVPGSAVAQLESGIFSPDEARRGKAMTIMDGLSRDNPAAYFAAFNENDRKRVDIYQRLAPLVPPEVLAEEMNPMVTTQQRELREARQTEGRALAATVDTGTILKTFGGGMFGGGSGAPADPLQATALRQDYEEAYAEAYARVPNEEEAKSLAGKWLANKWGPTDIGSSGKVVMPYPPERYYPPVSGSHDWMDADLDDAVHAQFPDAESWSLVPDTQTEADVSANVAPAYRVMVETKDGSYRLLGRPVAEGGPDERSVTYSAEPALIRFDYQAAAAMAEARFMEQRRRANDPRFRQSTGNKGGAVYQPPLPGDEPPPAQLPGAPPDPSIGHIR